MEEAAGTGATGMALVAVRGGVLRVGTKARELAGEEVVGARRVKPTEVEAGEVWEEGAASNPQGG